MGSRFLCPHCSRAGGRPGSPFTGVSVCCLCSKDYVRVQAITGLARRLKGVQGTPPEVVSKLFLKWAELTGETLAAEAMRALLAKWEEEDESSEAEREARKR